MAAIDLYSGIGGWTLGFRMAGIPVVASYEWWKDANRTHNMNFGSHHAETNIRELELDTLPNPRNIDFVVGSPPCTQFSYSNRGGNGDIKDGLVDIRKFLEVVEHMQPTYWAMENVPRVAKIIEKELGPKGKLRQFKHLFGETRSHVYNSSQFGVPQDRKRMIAGRLPFDLMDAYAANTERINLNEVLRSLRHAPYTDPIYGLQLPAGRLTDHILEPNLSEEEARLNEEGKTHHPVYNRMSFPDRQDRPSRTVTALCTRVSRESIVIRDHQGNLRRLTVRERASIQSFPMNYQFFGSSYPNTLKMIGNAVPPLLTFYIAQAMLGTPVDAILQPRHVPRERLQLAPELANGHIPDNEGANYPWSRSFWLAVRGLRFGSGVRFDIKNFHDKQTRTTTWQMNFYYGNSKAIKQKELGLDILERAMQATGLDDQERFNDLYNELVEFLTAVDGQGLQQNWINANRNIMGPIALVDALAGFVLRFKERLDNMHPNYINAIKAFIKREFKKEEPIHAPNDTEKKKKEGSELPKSEQRAIEIFIGMIIGASFNLVMQQEEVLITRDTVRA